MSKNAIVSDVLRKAVGTYARIMVRVAKIAEYYGKLAKASRIAICEERHGSGAKAKEAEIAEQIPPLPCEDEKGIDIPLGVAMIDGGDPFPDEWEELRGALAKENLPEMRDEAKLRHDSFVALFPTDATDYGWKAIEKAARALASLFDGLPLQGGKEDCRMTIEAFAGKCGVSIRTVKNWNAGKSPPTVFHPVLQEPVTYSQKLLDNPIEAERFAMLYKEHRRIKRAEREKVSYRGEETDRMNERKKRGIPPSTQQREAEGYDGVARDSDSARRLGYQSSIPSSWGT